MINTEIIDISKIKRPVIAYYEGSFREIGIEIYYPDNSFEFLSRHTGAWYQHNKNTPIQEFFETNLIAWQYI